MLKTWRYNIAVRLTKLKAGKKKTFFSVGNVTSYVKMASANVRQYTEKTLSSGQTEKDDCDCESASSFSSSDYSE